MIYTITFNPALDYIAQVENFEIGKVNRTKTEKILAGGKGLNVSIVLKNLGIDTTAISFVAGFTGDELEKIIKKYKINTDFIKVKNGYTRINVKIISYLNQSYDSQYNNLEIQNLNLENQINNSNFNIKIKNQQTNPEINKNNIKIQSKNMDKKIYIETALNGNGPEITNKEIEILLEKIRQIKSEDLVILSGNVPKCINEKIYEIISKELNQKNVPFVVDATQKLLVNTLQYKPTLIKPNKSELEETFNVKIKNEEDIIFYAKKLQKKGAQNVLISLGGDGAFLLTDDGKTYYSNAPKGNVINTVGAGDSMIAGFIAGFYKQNNYLEALKYGIASGSATAFGKELATKQDIEKLLEQVRIKNIKLKKGMI